MINDLKCFIHHKINGETSQPCESVMSDKHAFLKVGQSFIAVIESELPNINVGKQTLKIKAYKTCLIEHNQVTNLNSLMNNLYS